MKIMFILSIMLIIFTIILFLLSIIYFNYRYIQNEHIKYETGVSIDILIEREDRYFADLKYSSIVLIDIYNDLIYQKEIAIKNNWCAKDLLYYDNKIKLYKHTLDNLNNHYFQMTGNNLINLGKKNLELTEFIFQN